MAPVPGPAGTTGISRRAFAALLTMPMFAILASMYVLSDVQGRSAIFASLVYSGSFAPLERAAYSRDTEVRSVVIHFQGGLPATVRDAITSLTAGVPVVSARLAEEARTDHAARALAQAQRPSVFGLSEETSRAAQAPAVRAEALPAIVAGNPPLPTPTAPAANAPGGAISLVSTPPSATQAPQPTPALSPTPPPAPAATATAPSTATPAPAPRSESNGTSPLAPASTSPPAAAPPPATQEPSSQPEAPPVAAPPASPTPAPPAAPAGTASPVPINIIQIQTPTAVPASPTPPPATATAPAPTRTVAAATRTPTARPSNGPDPVVPPLLLDLSVPGGSSLNFQPIFSGEIELRAGDQLTRTVAIQNNGTLPFEYRLGTSGGAGPLWTDPTSGLQLTVRRNGVLVYSGPLQMPATLLGQLARGGQDTLSLEVRLPDVDNRFQGLSTSVSFDFTATALP